MRILFLLFFSLTTLAYGADKTTGSGDLVYPVPPLNSQRLFYLQRTPNVNTIVYDLNLTNDGKLNTVEPVKAYWIRYAENGQKQDLNYIQRKFAYGLTAKELDNGKKNSKKSIRIKN